MRGSGADTLLTQRVREVAQDERVLAQTRLEKRVDGAGERGVKGLGVNRLGDHAVGLDAQAVR